jgi:hypothetical protein
MVLSERRRVRVQTESVQKVALVCHAGCGMSHAQHLPSPIWRDMKVRDRSDTEKIKRNIACSSHCCLCRVQAPCARGEFMCRLLSGQRCVGVKVVQGGTLTRSSSKRSSVHKKTEKVANFCFCQGVKVTQQDCFMPICKLAHSPDSWVDCPTDQQVASPKVCVTKSSFKA